MAISEFNFSKTWTSSADFPATETDEAQARADLQVLHDEVRDYINTLLVPTVNANTSVANSALQPESKGVANGVASLGEDGKVPAAQLPEISTTSTKSATLIPEEWTVGDDGRYAQTVSVEGVTPASELVVVDVDLTTNDADARIEYLTAWAGPSGNECVQGNGTLTFYSYDLPTVAIPIFVGVNN